MFDIVDFNNCNFKINYTGIYIEGVSTQVNKWTVRDSAFDEIASSVFTSTNGSGTRIQRCKFTNCGNGTGTSANPTSSFISFGEYANNIVLNCESDRQQAANVVADETSPNIAEVENSDRTELIDRNSSLIYLTDSFRPISTFAATHSFITVNYTLRLGDHIRTGKLDITIGDSMSKVSLSDEYKYSDNGMSSPGGIVMTNFEFKVELRDNDTDSGIETVVLFYENPIATGALGNISYDLSYGA